MYDFCDLLRFVLWNRLRWVEIMLFNEMSYMLRYSTLL